MPRVNFTNVEEAQDYPLIPDGDQLFKVIRIDTLDATGDTRLSRAGDEQWGVQLEAVDGDHAGRYVWDNWTWGAGSMAGRMKLICKAFGFATDDEVDYQPAMFQDRYVIGTVITEVYKNKPSNKIAFAGYALAENAPVGNAPVAAGTSASGPGF